MCLGREIALPALGLAFWAARLERTPIKLYHVRWRRFQDVGKGLQHSREACRFSAFGYRSNDLKATFRDAIAVEAQSFAEKPSRPLNAQARTKSTD